MKKNIIIRNYITDDSDEIYKLFYDTVHSVNKQDYTEAQLNAWADGSYDKNKWNEAFLKKLYIGSCRWRKDNRLWQYRKKRAS